jgi:hypothetical protein
MFWRSREGQNHKMSDHSSPSLSVHGHWSSWNPWSPCSASCGANSIKTRTRTCTAPSPAFGGDSCPGQASEKTNCMMKPCPGKWIHQKRTCKPPKLIAGVVKGWALDEFSINCYGILLLSVRRQPCHVSFVCVYSRLDATRARVFRLRSWLGWWGTCPYVGGPAHCCSGAPVCFEILLFCLEDVNHKTIKVIIHGLVGWDVPYTGGYLLHCSPGIWHDIAHRT